MFAGHVAGEAACFGQLTNGVRAIQQQLDHLQPHGMGQRPQAFGRALKGFQVRPARFPLLSALTYGSGHDKYHV